MESRTQRIFLRAPCTIAAIAALFFGLPVSLQAQQQADDTNSVLDKIITPDMERRDITEDLIDTEDFELGVYYGVLSIEDFGSSSVTGARFAYHINEDFFFEAAYAQTDAGKTSFEVLNPSGSLLTDEEREFTYYNLSLGFNMLPGEVFIGKNWAFNSNFYIIAGAGNTDFAGDEHFTYNLGGGVRVFATDWLALHFDVRDHILSLDVFAEEKTTHNLEAHIGLTLFF